MAIKIRKKVTRSDNDPQEGVVDAIEGDDGDVIDAEVVSGGGDLPDLPPVGGDGSGLSLESDAGSLSDWFDRRGKKIALAVGVGFALVAALLIYQSVSESRAVQRGQALAKALTIADAALQPDIQTAVNNAKRNSGQVVKAPKSNYVTDVSRLEGAQSQLSEVISEYPDADITPEAHLLAGALAMRQNNAEGAKSHVDEAQQGLSGSSTEAFALQAQAIQRVNTGDVDGAIDVFKQLQQLDAKHYGVFALSQIALLYEQQGDDTQAAETYRELITMVKAPQNEGAEGGAQFNQNKMQRAIFAERRLKLLVDDPEAFLGDVTSPQ